MILDKVILNHIVLGNKKFEIKVTTPFNNLVIDFLVDFSNELSNPKKNE